MTFTVKIRQNANEISSNYESIKVEDRDEERELNRKLEDEKYSKEDEFI